MKEPHTLNPPASSGMSSRFRWWTSCLNFLGTMPRRFVGRFVGRSVDKEELVVFRFRVKALVKAFVKALEDEALEDEAGSDIFWFGGKRSGSCIVDADKMQKNEHKGFVQARSHLIVQVGYAL